VQTFRLSPYLVNNIPRIEIAGEITRANNQLSIRYEIHGETDQIVFPAKSESPLRKDDLWKATCFEFFIAIPNQPDYWEFNMSPSGNWNIYHMDAYRRIGFREEPIITQLLFEFKKSTGGYALDLLVDLDSIIQSRQVLQVGITAIIQTNDGNETYWALTHPGSQADFHLRESFIISL